MTPEEEHRQHADLHGRRKPWWWRYSPANPEVRERIESYGLSAAFHLGLLLLLGIVTLGGGGGRGDRVGDGAEGTIAQTADSAFSAEALEQVLEKQEVKPLEAELPRPRESVQPQLTHLMRSMPTQRLTGEGIGGGYGGGIGAGIGRDFGDFLGLLKRAGFDAVFVIDATGSMKYVIQEVQRKIITLVDLIQRLVPVARVGLVLYRDVGEDFVVRKSNLTFHGQKLQSFLRGVEAAGGGDWEEGLKEGLEAAIDEMNWRQRSKKVIVLVSSSPPHAEQWGAIDSLVSKFRSRGGVISAIDVSIPAHVEFERAWHKSVYGTEPEEISPLPAFYDEIRQSLTRIARGADGDMVALEANEAIIRELMVVAFGKEWEGRVAEIAKDL